MSPRFLLVHGTDTGVGKTAACAALAAWHDAAGERVLVVKVAQAGLDDGRGDAHEVARLANVSTRELARVRLPMAPQAAARLGGETLPRLVDVMRMLHEQSAGFDVVIVEGSGGVTVRLTADSATLVDIGRELAQAGARTDHLVTTRAGLGTLNHSLLTVDHLRGEGLLVTGLIIGSWPEQPGLVERTNLQDLPDLCDVPVLARLPAQCPAWEPSEFRAWAAALWDR